VICNMESQAEILYECLKTVIITNLDRIIFKYLVLKLT